MNKGALNHREQWRPVLEGEVTRWSTKSCEELAAELMTVKAYEISFEGKIYQVEVNLLENTDRYLHVAVSVDDGAAPESFRPLSSSFIVKKSGECKRPTTDDRRQFL